MKTLPLYDPYCVAFALAVGVEIISLSDCRTFEMRDDTGQASKALGQWKSNKALVNVTAYSKAIRQVRQIQAAHTAQEGRMNATANTFSA